MKRAHIAEPDTTKELTELALQGCLVAKDATANLRDYIENSSKMAMLAVSDCEKELDRMERRIDEEIASAITQVGESEARELLACVKFSIDLERIGDLAWSVTARLQTLPARLTREDSRDLVAMSEVLEKMLDAVHEGFVKRNLDQASWVLQTDSQIDHLCRSIFRRHLESRDRRRRDYSTSLLLMAQAFERAGDHAKNLGEELFHLVAGRSVRHERKRPGRSRQIASRLLAEDPDE
jgi:phosphate transport system protein